MYEIYNFCEMRNDDTSKIYLVKNDKNNASFSILELFLTDKGKIYSKKLVLMKKT